MRGFFLLVLSWAASVQAQDTGVANPPLTLDTVIIVDNSVPLMNGRLYPLPLEDAVAVRSADAMGAQISLQPGGLAASPNFSPGYNPYPAPQNNAEIAAGAIGGAIGNAMAEQEMLRRRQKELVPLKLAIPGLELRQRVFTALEQEATRRGLKVTSTVAHGIPDDAMAHVEFRQPSVQRVITLTRYSLPVLALSRDNSTPVFIAKMTLYGRTETGVSKLAQVHAAYVGRRAPGPQAPIEYWSQDKGNPYVVQVEQGVRAMLAALLNPTVAGAPPGPKKPKSGEEDAVRMIAVADGLAFARMYQTLTVIAPLPEVEAAASAGQ